MISEPRRASDRVLWVIPRLLSAAVSCVTMGLTYKVVSFVFQLDFPSSEDFPSINDDPGVFLLLPLILAAFLFGLQLLAVLMFTSVIFAVYALHPPLAAWILGELHEKPKPC